MPTADEHQGQAEHNLRFLQTVDSAEFCDWMAVVAFYVAVHLVERLRALAAGHSIDHADRNEFVRNDHPAIHVHYRELYNVSLIVRYGVGPFHWLVPENVSGHLEEIQRYVAEYVPPGP
jgi:hypothetical protein